MSISSLGTICTEILALNWSWELLSTIMDMKDVRSFIRILALEIV